MTRIALFQSTTGIDPKANARGLVDAIDEAAAGGAEILFTPEMSGLLDSDTARASAGDTALPPFEVCAAAFESVTVLRALMITNSHLSSQCCMAPGTRTGGPACRTGE